MSRDKQIPSTDWLTKGYSEEELASLKADAIKEAEAELRDKQIEEMVSELKDVWIVDWDGNVHTLNEKLWEDELENIAIELHNIGYRKASDVTMAIFEEIEKRIADLEYRANTPRKTVKVEELKEQVNWILHEVVPSTIAELKEKYEARVRDER